MVNSFFFTITAGISYCINYFKANITLSYIFSTWNKTLLGRCFRTWTDGRLVPCILLPSKTFQTQHHLLRGKLKIWQTSTSYLKIWQTSTSYLIFYLMDTEQRQINIDKATKGNPIFYCTDLSTLPLSSPTTTQLHSVPRFIVLWNGHEFPDTEPLTLS